MHHTKAVVICLAVSLARAFAATNPAELIAAATRSAADVTDKSYEGTGQLVVVLEERHDSPPAAMQEAIVLERLHKADALDGIALEGYLADDAKASQGRGMPAQAAVEMLSAGEISSAEFMHLVRGTQLYAIEQARDYQSPAERSEYGSMIFLMKIALATTMRNAKSDSLDAETKAKMLALQQSIATAKGEERDKKIAEFQVWLVGHDSWTKDYQERTREKCGARPTAIEESIAQIRLLEARVKEVGAQIDPKEQELLDGYRKFLEARESASTTMVDATSRIADAAKRPIAMIIGAGHSQKVTELLKARHRPFVLLTPIALKNCEPTGADTPEARAASAAVRERYERLTRGEPPGDDFLSNVFREAFVAQMKPKPLVTQTWFQARTELLSLVDDLSRHLLSAGGQTPPPPKGPGGPSGVASGPGGPDGPGGLNGPAWRSLFGPDDDKRRRLLGDESRWRGTHVAIDLASIKPVPVDGDENARAVVFRVTLNPGSNKSRDVWIAARQSGPAAASTQPAAAQREEDVEALLEKKAGEIDENKVKPEKAVEEKLAPDFTVLKSVSPDVEITVAKTQAEAERVAARKRAV